MTRFLSRTSLRSLLYLGLAFTVVPGLVACDDGPTDDGPSAELSVVSGAVSDSSGAQSVSAGLSATASSDLRTQTRSVAVASINVDGSLTVHETTDIAQDGSFSIDTAPRAETFAVLALDASGEVVGGAIAPSGNASRSEVMVGAITQETSAELDVLLELTNRDDKPADDVDSVGLMTLITAEVAATSDTMVMSDAAQAASDAELEVFARASTTLTARELGHAKQSAHAELMAQVDADATVSANSTVWSDFYTRLYADVEAATDADHTVQADAAAAAAVAFKAVIAQGGDDDAAAHASASALLNASMADRSAQHVAATRASASANVSASIDTAYTGLMTDLSTSTSADDIQLAYAKLIVRLSGFGNDDAAGESTLKLFIDERQDVDASVYADLAAAAALTADAAVELQTRLDTATTSTTQVDAIASAFVDFEAAASAAFTSALDSELDGDVRAFASAFVLQASGDARSMVDLDVFAGIVVDLGITVSGAISAGVGLQQGLQAAIDGASAIDLEGAVRAELVSLQSNGELSVLATGTVDSAARAYSITDVDVSAATDLFVQVIGESDRAIGRVAVDADAIVNSETDYVARRSMDHETTTQVDVVAELVARGMTTDEIDHAAVESTIDAAVAAAVVSEADIDSLATAIVVASEVHARLLATSTSDLNSASAEALANLEVELSALTDADRDAAGDLFVAFDSAVRASHMAESGVSGSEMADAEAAAATTFSAALEAMATNNSDLVAAGNVRAYIESSSALAAANSARLSESTLSSDASTQLSAAVDTFHDAMIDAEGMADVASSAQVFTDAMVGADASGSLMGDLINSNGALDLLAAAEVDAGLTAAATAATAFHTAVDAAVAGATATDVDTAVSTIVAAYAQLETQLNTALTLDAFSSLAAANETAAVELIGHVSVGGYGNFGAL